jgi:hypothetical protein
MLLFLLVLLFSWIELIRATGLCELWYYRIYLELFLVEEFKALIVVPPFFFSGTRALLILLALSKVGELSLYLGVFSSSSLRF